MSEAVWLAIVAGVVSSWATMGAILIAWIGLKMAREKNRKRRERIKRLSSPPSDEPSACPPFHFSSEMERGAYPY